MWLPLGYWNLSPGWWRAEEDGEGSELDGGVLVRSLCDVGAAGRWVLQVGSGGEFGVF